MTVLLRSRAELREWQAQTHGPRGVVLTMGALHAGHLALVDAARTEVPNGTVLVTVFVNPAQFGPNEDFEKYPRTLEDDVALCEAHGVDAVFAPTVDEVYPVDEVVRDYDPGPKAVELEGEARPGHFAGVLKVVSRLLQLTNADVTCFGEKDYQQLVVVRQLNALEPALAHVRFVGVPTMRDPDGLALSSRNRYLTDLEREQALAIPRCIERVQQACTAGVSAQSAALAGFTELAQAPGVTVDYVTVRAQDLGPAPGAGIGRVLIAAKVGRTRLIDNAAVVLGGGA
jgi:pantoate--beta-alanine ligase